jgi:hypothetical protein
LECTDAPVQVVDVAASDYSHGLRLLLDVFQVPVAVRRQVAVVGSALPSEFARLA